MKVVYWRIIPFFLFMILVLFFWRGLSLDPRHLPSAQIGRPLPEFRLPLLGHEYNQEVFTQTAIRGHLALLNVWASWCASCVDEQFFLMQLAHEGMPIYGVNYKDNPREAMKWLAEWGNPYTLVGSDHDGRVAIDLGVYGAPETFLVDKSGVIRYRHAGVLTASIWEKEFLPRVHELERAS